MSNYNYRDDNDLSLTASCIKDEPISYSEHFVDNDFDDYPRNFDYGAMRKSLSMTDISHHFNKWRIEQSKNEQKQTSRLRTERDTKYKSTAELIYHYQRDTPERFHTSRRQTSSSRTSVCTRLPLTIPQSPMLHSKARIRTMHIPSQKEREEKEVEEMRKFKIKANPVPKCVLQGPRNLPEVSKKPITVPSPFKVTAVQKKIVQVDLPKQVFKARPAPKTILEKPQEIINLAEVCRHEVVKPEPFSFEKRDVEMFRRKEEKIKQVIKEERKQASMFKAQPLPGSIRKNMKIAADKSTSSTHSSENKENNFKFEARPPSVLFKEPFKPILKTQQIKPEPFMLSSLKRAAEREKFDQHLKEKEAEQERLRLLEEKEMKQSEEKSIAELRAKLVHHPKPVPAVDPFVPAKSVLPITIPETPKFVRRLKQNQKISS